jgi:hypothetical protein
MARPSSRSEWVELATVAAYAFIRERGAVVWPEVEAFLSESSWVHDNLDSSIPTDWCPQPHHLTTARKRLVNAGAIRKQAAVLNGRLVSTWIDAVSSQQTATDRLAATKRRCYRTYLSWTNRAQLCGAIAEQVVHRSLTALAGRYLWIPDHKPGKVTLLCGQPITVGGPLDSAGFWPLDPQDPSVGLVPFAVEIKNIRDWIYPWDHEHWDLLAKLAAFPRVIPVLVARKIHPLTFKCLADIGALGRETKCQWFANEGTTQAPLDPEKFDQITRLFGFRDAVPVTKDIQAHPPTTTWFQKVPTYADGTLLPRSVRRWNRAAPIVSKYIQLRNENLRVAERSDMWAAFVSDIQAAGLYQRGGWGEE